MVSLAWPVILAEIGWVLMVQGTVPLVALILGSAVVAEEIEDRTITYLFTRPIPRAAVLLGRWLATALVLELCLLLSAELTFGLLQHSAAVINFPVDRTMPEGMADRYKHGDDAITQDSDDVTVVFADIVGFEELALTMSSEEAVARLNDLVRSFDEAAERHGVERVRTTRQSYLASCGLATPRVDNARRAVEFALEIDSILERYSAQQGVKLGLRAGLDAGQVTSGLIGRARVVYDMWGDAVNLAFRVQGDSDEPGIYVTQRVADRLPDSIPVHPAGDIQTQSGAQRVWKVEAPVVTVEG